MRTYIESLEQKCIEKEQNRVKKEITSGIPPKYKKMSLSNANKQKFDSSAEHQKVSRFKFDLVCLEALKKSSTHSQNTLEESLITLLELTEDIYKMHE